MDAEGPFVLRLLELLLRDQDRVDRDRDRARKRGGGTAGIFAARRERAAIFFLRGNEAETRGGNPTFSLSLAERMR